MLKIYGVMLPSDTDELPMAQWMAAAHASLRTRVQRLVTPAAAARSLAANRLLVWAFRTTWGPEARVEEIRRDVLNKPYLPERPQWQFNLSHSGQLVVCAVADKPVGVDVEKLRRLSDGAVARFMTVEEQLVYWRDNANMAYAIQLWTMKESCVKRTGKGIGDILRDPAVLERETGICTKLTVPVGYAGAVCGEEAPKTGLEMLDISRLYD